MTLETGELQSGIHSIAETAVRIDQLLTEAKEMALKLEETSDSLNKFVAERGNDASGE
jgi:predicted ATP-grasp superfamily ATP-dependent carboligase